MSVTWLKGLCYLVCCLPPIECFFVFPFMHASRHDGASVYLAKPIKQHVEVGQHCSPGNLHYIVKGLTGVVAQTAVRIIETGKNRINEFFKVQSRILNSTKDKKHKSKPPYLLWNFKHTEHLAANIPLNKVFKGVLRKYLAHLVHILFPGQWSTPPTQ